MHPREQTIFALSSGRPPAAIAVVRVSGPQARMAVETFAGRVLEPRIATRVLLRDGEGPAIDDAIVLWFPGPASATGEDVAEFQVHGGRAVLAALFAALSRLENTRAAEPGEFTRRAFENGKIDLTEAEALDDLIHADTDRQRRQALRQLQGLLGDRARDWRARVIQALALIEAGIDFSDEGDVPAELIAPALATVESLVAEIADALAGQGRSERLRDGVIVAIAGPPNVGKSTLINVLARREVAIVSPYAGTTRDLIEVQLDLDGYPVTVIDTAGIRDTDDPIEQEGVRRARSRAAEADLVLWMTDADRGQSEEKLKTMAATLWTIRNKIDLGSVNERAEAARGDRPGQGAGTTFKISAREGIGISTLVAALAAFARDYFGSGEDGLIGRERQRNLLRETVAALERCLRVAGAGDELAAEELRMASQSLGRLLGRVDVEDVLDKIFREFCIGK
ncbi:tRNA uridine-5-carboxymethylaminomethyl(34) synthesis GTPase MnmE [Bradyrhizobium sp.]|uniref:tRNA uridine-5-carboxymethylaminomethyl(34) synthesis GTPase MnmE n=1 Tax=Bradyrhizobium sp. TaxID=376 RepID=UPI0023A6195F|nr:tRNA uridine-5-carboxymethylaminomethyl(34) synthesis GTPase MnmE [Bradyrhizobium sp.]MDE1934349.1 tRNA uridine-5-carboxymethylaminomethyl(34) synthesis GTPase MnmE [Bradyrhizobium sp.]